MTWALIAYLALLAVGLAAVLLMASRHPGRHDNDWWD